MQVEVLAILCSAFATVATAAGLFYFHLNPLVSAAVFVIILAGGAGLAVLRERRTADHDGSFEGGPAARGLH